MDNLEEWYCGVDDGTQLFLSALHQQMLTSGERKCLKPGNTEDRKLVKKLTKGLTGELMGDSGYFSKKLFENLLQEGLQLITMVRKHMKNRLMPIMDKLLLRKRFIIEPINDQLKNISQIEYSRHRSLNNFRVNYW